MAKPDQELERYRALMTVPDRFDEGFSFTSFIGVLFVALVMVPGALYMDLLAGAGIGPAAQWVTVILFIEVAKRANAKLKRAQIFILFYLAGTIVASQGQGLIFNQFLVRSEAALSFGLAGQFPEWLAPSDPAAYETRSFLQWAWAPAIGLMLFRMFFSRLDNMILGYGLFRVASDVERLPFPLAPIGAQGIMALADDLDGGSGAAGAWRWRVFAIGGALGLVFGLVYLGIPTLTGALLGKTMSVFPIPFTDWTGYTQGVLPAVATGMCFDLGQFIIGMVMPYWAMIGSALGLLVTFCLNPILYHAGILRTWTPGDSTVVTMFKNNIDFYFSLGIGLSVAIAVIGLMSVLSLRRRARLAHEQLAPVPKERGDMPNWLIIGCYLVSTLVYILVSGWLIDWHPGVMVVLLFFGFLYTPIVSYVTARLEGIAGQVVEIPFIREMALILSGYSGVKVWFIPIPQANYGGQTVFYRQAELTGTRFTSIWKAELFLFPVIVIATIGFSSFIWSLAEVPSSVYPFAQQMWELNAKNACLVYSSTSGEFSDFQQALNGPVVAIGTVAGMLLFGGLSWVGAPVTLAYGLIRGIGQAMPHTIIPNLVGALIGKYYFERKLGLKWREYVPVLSAGFFCGGGLITMFCIGLVFLSKSSNPLPY